MKENASEVGLDEEEMFTLGMRHDIGYEFDEKDHHTAGYHLLHKQGYKYAYEVKYHGLPNAPRMTTELKLLNYADMHINAKGEYVSFEDWLEDIKSRRGENSPHYQNSKKIIEQLDGFIEDKRNQK
jgi:hypothetical protein